MTRLFCNAITKNNINMKKDELVKRAAAKCGMTHKQVKASLDALLGIIGCELADGGEVVLPDFGKFHVKSYKEHKMRPFGKMEVVVPAKTRMRFKPYANIHLYSTKY